MGKDLTCSGFSRMHTCMLCACLYTTVHAACAHYCVVVHVMYLHVSACEHMLAGNQMTVLSCDLRL